jgi:hypothetical protein
MKRGLSQKQPYPPVKSPVKSGVDVVTRKISMEVPAA